MAIPPLACVYEFPPVHNVGVLVARLSVAGVHEHANQLLLLLRVGVLYSCWFLLLVYFLILGHALRGPVLYVELHRELELVVDFDLDHHVVVELKPL